MPRIEAGLETLERGGGPRRALQHRAPLRRYHARRRRPPGNEVADGTVVAGLAGGLQRAKRDARLASGVAGFDLHAHSDASDGSFSPAKVVALAAEAGLEGFALTDHDTLAGLPEAEREAKGRGIQVLRGVELSVDVLGQDAHLLAYGPFDPNDHSTPFARLLARGRESRDRRNPRILERLRAHGIAITIAEVEAFAQTDGKRNAATRGSGSKPLGRPHIAGVLVEKGVVHSVAEAFDLWLAEGRPAFVPRDRLAVDEAIDAVHSVGGVAVLAHATTLKTRSVGASLEAARKAGLDGVEVWHPLHDASFASMLSGWAETHDLLRTGGSDFHGAPKPTITMGQVRVERPIWESLTGRLAAAESRGAHRA
ncbi:MAG: PHP domain-containing protein [Thermoplasmatota archaeon]